MQEDCKNFKGLADTLPPEMDAMMQCLKEMKNGSEPDESADYWEERKKIDQNISDLKNTGTNFDKLQKDFNKKKGELDAVNSNLRKLNAGGGTSDVESLHQCANDLEVIAGDMEEKLNEAFEIRDEVQDIKKDMGECEIPVNIAMRRSELS